MIWPILAAIALSRCWKLGQFPIFIDEAIDISRALTIAQPRQSNFWVAFTGPLGEGKFLHVFFYSLVSRWAPDVLAGSRIVSVAAGLASAYCCYVAGKRLFGASVGLVAAFLYGLSPLGLFYDRLAIADSILCACAAFTIAATIAVLQEPGRRSCAALGLALGLSPLAKITGVAIWAVPPLVYLLLGGFRPPGSKLRNSLVAAYAVAFVLLGAVYIPAFFLCPQRPVSTVLYMTALAAPSPGLLGSARAAGERLALAAGWIGAYNKLPLMLAAAAAPFLAFGKLRRPCSAAAGICVLLFAIPASATSIIFARHFLWTAAPLALLAAFTCVHAAKLVAGRWRRIAIAGGMLALIAAPCAWWDYRFLTDAAKADLPAPDRLQYIEGWPSGFGVDAAARSFRDEAGPFAPDLNIICPEFSSTANTGLPILLRGEDRIHVRWRPLRTEADFAQLLDAARSGPTYVVVDRPLVSAGETDIRRLAAVAAERTAYPKPGGRSVDVYRVSSR